MLINLVVGAIINNYQEVHDIEMRMHGKVDASDARIQELLDELNTLMRHRMQDQIHAPR